jgi:D-amino-acid oxidase
VKTQRTIVVGAGVIGLTTAVRLAEAGHEVAVIARDLPPETTSAVAAALWYPYRAEPPDLVLGWALQSFLTYSKDAVDPELGVHLVDGLELRRTFGEPWFIQALPDEAGFNHFSDVPDGYVDGWQLRLPVIEPSTYLSKLVSRLEKLGGSITRTVVTAFPDDALVVNCTGLGSRWLTGDQSITPIRGQVVRVEQVNDVDAWLLDQGDEATPVYVVPRSKDIVVGGTADIGDFDPQSHDEATTAIMSRASRLVPALAQARILGVYAGLRPARSEVRLETETRPDGGHIIHNYGHGGAGWTVAWGCADEVVRQIQRIAKPVAAPAT